MWIFDWSYVAEELKGYENERPSFCTLIFDVVAGFNFWRGCKIHDFFYGNEERTKKNDWNNVDSRWKADMVFLEKLFRVVREEAVSGLHATVGYITAIIYFTAVRVLGWMFYQPGWFYKTFRA